MGWLPYTAIAAPLWLCAVGFAFLVLGNRALRTRPGNVRVRLRRPGKRRWVRGHAVWVHDTFSFRGSPAAWREELVWVADVHHRPPLPGEGDGWHELGSDPVVAVLRPYEALDAPMEVAARAEHRDLLVGPFMRERTGATS